MTKIYCFTIICSVLFCCNNKNNVKDKVIVSKDSIIKLKKAIATFDSTRITEVENDSNSERVFKIILDLPEVKKRADYIETQTKGKRHLSCQISETPNENGGKYYWVKVGEINEIAFVTHFNFFVYKDFKIKYYDTINDSIISLETWRKNNKDNL